MSPEKELEIEPNGKSVLQSVVGVIEPADGTIESIAQTVDSAAQLVQATLRRTERGARGAMKQVSEGIQTSTDYLTGKGIGGVVEDVEALIRRHPFQAILIGFSMGCLLSRSRKH